MRSYIIILFWLLLTSCELVTQIDIPEDTRKIVVNAIFTPDSTWMISISMSTPIQGFSQLIKDPSVILTDENGQQIPLTIYDEPLVPGSPVNSLIGDVVFRSTSRPQPGMTYRMDVTATNAESATATADTPDPVGLIDVKIDSANKIVGNDEYYIIVPIEFTFDDPAGQEDHYYPILVAYYSYEYPDPITGEMIEQKYQVGFRLVKKPPGSDLFEFDQEVRALSDNGFDGERHTERLYAQSFYMGPGSEEADSLRFFLCHASKDYVKYFETMDVYNSARGNPFAEPVQIYTNIESGLGIFAGWTPTYWDFK